MKSARSKSLPRRSRESVELDRVSDPAPVTWKPIALLAGLTLGCLLPFIAKPFHIDDPLFLWAAKHIQTQPLSPYGFSVNWYGYAMPMSEVTKNPPLAAYYIAAAAWPLGWNEIGIHLALLLPAVGVVLATYFLARRLSAQPIAAALIALLTPGFLVSATTVMSDVLMLVLWLAAIICCLRGTRTDRSAWYYVSGLLIGAAALTKYFAVTLIPLLLLYSILQGARARRAIPALALPVILLALYQWATADLYGRGLLADAFSYSAEFSKHASSQIGAQGLILLAFTGGCVASVLFCLPLIWSRKILIAAASGAVAIGLLLISSWQGLGLPLVHGNAPGLWQIVQMAILAAAGACVIGLAVSDYRRHRSPEAALLAVWIVGTFIFAGFINWSVNGRSILPMIPAAAIVIARRLDQRVQQITPAMLAAALVPAGILALVVCQGDYAVAQSAKNAAIALQQRYDTSRLWFQGHWGFQYYLEAAGARPMDVKNPAMQPGDVIAYPIGGTNVNLPPEGVLPQESSVSPPISSWASTMVPQVAGFYASIGRPLPFVIGPVPPDVYRVYRMPR